MEVIPIPIDAEIKPADDLAGMIASATDLRNGDILVVAQKAISKQEGRMVKLDSVNPTILAEGIASQYEKDPRIVELVLSESARIVRMRDGIIITRMRSGIVCANAGVDESNVMYGYATLLPTDPDASALRLQSAILDITGVRLSVIISDTFGRPFRTGQTNCAIGVAGLEPMAGYAGRTDSFGRMLRVTEIAVADELAAAAELVMGKIRRVPAAAIRGYHMRKTAHNTDHREHNATEAGTVMIRDHTKDLFA